MKKTKPCKECPFNKKANLSIKDLGNASPETYIGQLNGSFWLPCHMEKNYNGKESSPDDVRICAGAAMLRSKLPIKEKFKSHLTPILEDTDNSSFDSCADFMTHYKKIPLEEAEKLTDNNHIKAYVTLEYSKLMYEGKLWRN
jgi:hypothetical protein